MIGKVGEAGDTIVRDTTGCKVDGAVDTFVRDTTDWKSWWS